MKEVFSVEMKKSKEFEDGKLDSIKIEASISRHLEFDESKELFVGLNKEESSQSLGLVIIESITLVKMICCVRKLTELTSFHTIKLSKIFTGF